jgi:outer membrane lipoprotein carrier protein
LSLLTFPIAERDPISIVEKSEALYAGSKTFSARFTQVLSSGDFFEEEVTEGKLLMQYPESFRIETPEQVIVSNGDTLWSYSEENKQVTVEPTTNVEDLVTPADYLFHFKADYDLKYDTLLTFGKEKAHRLQLTRKAKDHYVQSMEILIGLESSHILRVRYLDINDNEVTLEFSGWEFGIKIDPVNFRFVAPKGVEEIRLP